MKLWGVLAIFLIFSLLMAHQLSARADTSFRLFRRRREQLVSVLKVRLPFSRRIGGSAYGAASRVALAFHNCKAPSHHNGDLPVFTEVAFSAIGSFVPEYLGLQSFPVGPPISPPPKNLI